MISSIKENTVPPLTPNEASDIITATRYLVNHAMSPSADKLNEALEMAEDLFAKSFVSPAEVRLESGALLRFQKRGLYSGATGETPLKSTSLRERVEVSFALPRLWDACKSEDDSFQHRIEAATSSVLAFVKEHGAHEG